MARGINRMFTLTKKVSLVLQRSVGVGEYSDVTGKWVPASRVAADPIDVNIQPMKFSHTMMMDAAERTKEWLNLRSISEIRKAEENQWEADTFTYNGKAYKVMDVKRYTMGVLDHYHALAALDSPTPRSS